jgi:hypothetical protein
MSCNRRIRKLLSFETVYGLAVRAESQMVKKRFEETVVTDSPKLTVIIDFLVVFGSILFIIWMWRTA